MKQKKSIKNSFNEDTLDRKARKANARKSKGDKKKLSIYDVYDEEDDLLNNYRIKNF